MQSDASAGACVLDRVFVGFPPGDGHRVWQPVMATPFRCAIWPAVSEPFRLD